MVIGICESGLIRVSMVGIDIGNNNCKLAVRDGKGMKLVSARMPENMARAGDVVSPELMAKFLREVRSSEGVRDRDCTLVIDSSQVFFRRITLPPMTISELKLNLPYEFRDFITDNPDEYMYDYAVDEIIRDENGEIVSMELYAAAASKELLEKYSAMLRRAGFKLKMVTPAPMAYARLLNEHVKMVPEHSDKDVALVNLGHADVVISLFCGKNYDSSRTIDFGCDEFDHIIADIKGIDPYTANSYKFSNYDNVLDEPECLSLCDRFALEVSKVVNFYNFNNPDSEIELICFLGGGASITQLVSAIAEAVDVPVITAQELLPNEVLDEENAAVCALAVAGVLEGEAM